MDGKTRAYVPVHKVVDYYDSVASRYDEEYESPAYSHVRKVEWETIAQYISIARSAVDVGCGTGYYTILLAKRGLSVLGIDVSKEMLERAASKIEELGLENVTLLEHDIERELQLNERFDMALSMFGTLNHTESLENAFHTIQNLMAPGGMFIFTLSNPFKLHRLWGALREHRFLAMMRGNFPVIAEIYLKGEERRVWLHFYTRREVEDLLEKLNFDVLRVGGIFFWMNPRRSVLKDVLRWWRRAVLWGERKAMWWFPVNALSGYVIFVCRKR